jgi:hypothetical protein
VSRLSVTVPLPLWVLTQGLVTVVPPSQIPDTACSEVQNMVGYEGMLRRRPGFSSTLDSVGANQVVHHLGRRVGMDGTIQRMALSRNTSTNALKAYYWTGAAWSDITGAAALTLTEGQHAFSTVFKGSWYFVTGNDPLYKWTGSGNISEVTNANASLKPYPNPKVLYSWDARLWTADSEDGAGSRVPYRLAWSDHLLDNVWRGGVNAGSSGFVDLADDSDPITGLVDQVDFLVVFKPQIIYLGVNAQPPDYYSFPKLSRGMGCVSGATIQRYYESLLFLGDDNVYMMEGRQVQPIANSIRNRLRDIVALSNISRSFALIDPDNILYWLFLPKTGTTNLITLLIYSLRDQAWWEGEIALNSPTTLLPLCGLSYRSGTWTTEKLIGSADGKVYKIDETVGTDDGKEFSAKWVSKQWDAISMSRGDAEAMALQRVMIHGESGKVKVQCSLGPNLDRMVTETIGEVSLNGKGPNYLSTNLVDRFLQLILVPDSTDPPKIQGMTVHVLNRGEVR